MKCADCQWRYPEAILSEMFINSSYTAPICGICALLRANKATGVNRERFSGRMVESNRLAAIRWRSSHPQDAPQVM